VTQLPDPLPTTAPPPYGDAGATSPQVGQELTHTFQPTSDTRQGATETPAVPGYEIEGVLGRGGMGVVYKAKHLALKRTVALKMILAGGQAGEQDRARFKAEAEAVARLQHPNIVQVFEVGEQAGHPFCALEFVDGGSLAQKLHGEPLSPREAARLVEELARAVHLAHARNVVHRDLKPANVLLAQDGTPKITDFGLARKLDADSGVTQAGAIMGTPSYMAPEQAGGQAHEAGPPADVWALGAILYECLTGRPPFRGACVLETLEQVRSREPAAPRSLNAKVPRDLETVCLKCLRKEPERRYASAAELAEELARFLRGEPVQARSVGRLERAVRWAWRNPALALALAAVVLFLIGTAALASWVAVLANQKADLATETARKLQEEKDATDKANDKLQGMLTRTWLSPLAKRPGPLIQEFADAVVFVD
jgi:serine/threonine-protein kinase